MSKINRKQRKQLARDIAKIMGKKITYTLRTYVTPLVEDKKSVMFSDESLYKLSQTGFRIIEKLAHDDKRINTVYFEPVVYG